MSTRQHTVSELLDSVARKTKDQLPSSRHPRCQSSIEGVRREIRSTRPGHGAKLVHGCLAKPALVSQRFENRSKQPIAEVDLARRAVLKFHVNSIAGQR